MSTKHRLAHRFYTGQISYDFVGHKKFWYAFSAVVFAACFLAVGFKGLVLGIDFRDGTNFQVAMPVTETTVDEVRTKVAGFEVKDLEAQVFSLGESAVQIQTRSLDPEETVSVRAAIAELADVKPADVTYTAIGASWGEQISLKDYIMVILLGASLALTLNIALTFIFNVFKINDQVFEEVNKSISNTGIAAQFLVVVIFGPHDYTYF